MADAPEDSEPEEDVDLTPEQRRYVLDLYPRLLRLNAWDLLGLSRDADQAAIRRAYFKLARFVHPDRHYGKRLGSYKVKLDAIFVRITKAYELLSTPSGRTEAQAAVARPAPAPAPTPAPAPAPSDADRRKGVLEALLQRNAKTKARAAELAAAAARARASGDVTAAEAAYRQALEVTPGDPALLAAHAEVAGLVAERRCEAHRRQAALAESQGRWPLAAASWQQVVQARPDDAEARARLQQALARASAPTR